MARVVGSRRSVCATIALLWALSGRAWPAESLRLVTNVYWGPFADKGVGKAPGSSVEVIGQVFAAMGEDVSFESLPTNRAWMMIVRGERDGMFGVLRTNEREQICSYPDEPLVQDRWVLFVRTADVEKLKFSSFDDLADHDVAVSELVLPGSFEHPDVSPELEKSLREHHNMVETSGTTESLRMLAAGRVDYALAGLVLAKRDIATMGLSGKIEPLLSRSVIEQGIYVCFSKARVSPAFVDAFSRALREFKQTGAFQVIYRKYFP